MFSPQPFRPSPALPVGAMKTYGIRGYTRRATCEEYGCANYERGWITKVDETTELGQRQAHYIRTECRSADQPLASALGVRRYIEGKDSDGRTTFTFPAGQECFGEHRVPADRPELLVVRDGDWRGNPTGRHRRHVRPEDWVEDFAEHQDGLAHEQGKG